MKLKLNDLVFLKSDVCSQCTIVGLPTYRIEEIKNDSWYGVVSYKLLRVNDGFMPDKAFNGSELIIVSHDNPIDTPDVCCTEAPSPYHDKHYNGCIIEPILLMQQHLTKEQFEGFLLGNIIKYRVRAGHKDDAKKDIDKAMRYEQWLREFQEKGTITL